MVTREEMKQIADTAAEGAVRKIFLVLGYDVDDSTSLLELQADLAHTRKWRHSVEQVRTVGLKAAVMTLTTGTLGLIWYAIQAKIGKAG